MCVWWRIFYKAAIVSDGLPDQYYNDRCQGIQGFMKQENILQVSATQLVQKGYDFIYCMSRAYYQITLQKNYVLYNNNYIIINFRSEPFPTAM